MNKYHNSLHYLISKNTNEIPHGNKTFFDHLVGVYNILKKTNHEEDVCLAGLFHSIYGNDIFNYKTEKNRENIKNIIGKEAEELVWIFNNTPREILKETGSEKIQSILVANELDQNLLFEVYDNYYDHNDIDMFYGEFRDNKKWSYTASAIPNSNNRKFYYKLNKKNTVDKKLFHYANEILKEKKLTKFVELSRAYAGAYVYGFMHEIHQDEGESKLNEVFTIMFYLNKKWDITYGGETYFLDHTHNNLWKSILPKPARVILFDGSIPHAAREVSRICTDLRMVATFKYKVTKELI
tara:strand:+ start:2362 stop:3249 length:888 start_codon:yes stop_codon:yes gene_type:complete